jgi:GT2 family glycosyltransferase
MSHLPIVKVGVPTLHRYDLMARFCLSFAEEKQPCLIPEITILDNGGDFLSSDEGRALMRNDNLPPIRVVVPEYNFGVAKSWNYFAKNLGQCIISNDDVVMTTKTIKNFVDAFNCNQDACIIEGSHKNEGFSTFFLANAGKWLSLGGFDECFYPAYFEDDDTRYRLKIAGFPTVKIDISDWRHDNSSTLHGSDHQYQRSHWGSFFRNQAYYIQKWGGLPGFEKFVMPFKKSNEFGY